MTMTRVAEKMRFLNGPATRLKAVGMLFSLGLCGLLLLAACGGGGEESTASAQQTQTPAGTPKPPGSGIDPCALVTKEDAEAILGSPVDEPKRQTLDPFETCIYSAGTLAKGVQLLVGSDVYTTDSGFDDAMESAARSLGVEPNPIPGLGDKAYWLAGSLWVLKGNITFNLMVLTPELTDPQRDEEVREQEALSATTDLAKKVLLRIP